MRETERSRTKMVQVWIPQIAESTDSQVDLRWKTVAQVSLSLPP